MHTGQFVAVCQTVKNLPLAVLAWCELLSCKVVELVGGLPSDVSTFAEINFIYITHLGALLAA